MSSSWASRWVPPRAYNPFLLRACLPKLKRSMDNFKERLLQALKALKATDEPLPAALRAPDSLQAQYVGQIMHLNQIRKFKRFYWDTNGKQLSEALARSLP